ncbi:DUF4861 domain-containing protein [Pontibacter diazotrophicus]|uniref:DUF4861 domain-containing protein n=1 Tax=Pontibacter diazotrophicus TaxID=1400979 RepID=A0A3D8LDE6_9BACT|nr:DUF4861 domain-containing protein [Pontibacter diazotrophicus]RDV15417.1 DUF4861 domain-containing protein [Pontibacter diazotrophicus]
MLLSCQSETEDQAQEIVLTNQSAVALTDKAIAVKRDQLSGMPDGAGYPVLLTQTGDTLAAQLDDLDGDNEWDELFFVTDLPANGEQILQLSWASAQPEYTTRTSVRFGKRSSADSPVQPSTSDTLYANQLPKSAGIGYQPYQTDGPAWENDKVGFRHYLDGRNAKDIFGKKVSYMSPETVGISNTGAVEDNYHEMKEWGRDIMAVGSSTGIGGIALMVGDTPYRLGVTVNDTVNNVENTTFNILTEGPVRSMMHLRYNNWKPDGTDRTYTVEEQPTIWPGMYAYRNTASVSGLQGDETLLIGMNNLDQTDSIAEINVDDEWVVLLTHDRETYDNEWILGLALILPKDAYQGYMEAPTSGRLAQAYFAKMKAQENQPVTYYAVGGWELSNEAFKDSSSFRNYVQDLTRQLAAEVDVQVR